MDLIIALVKLYLIAWLICLAVALLLEIGYSWATGRWWLSGLRSLSAKEILGDLYWILFPLVGQIIYLGRIRMLCRTRLIGNSFVSRADPADFPF